MDINAVLEVAEVLDKLVDTTIETVNADLACMDMTQLVDLESKLNDMPGGVAERIANLVAGFKIERFMDFVYHYKSNGLKTCDSWDSVAGFQHLFSDHPDQAHQIELRLRSENWWNDDWAVIVASVTFDYAM